MGIRAEGRQPTCSMSGQDMSRSVSFELQRGRSPREMAEKAIRYDDGRPCSLYGVLVDAVVAHHEEEESHG